MGMRQGGKDLKGLILQTSHPILLIDFATYYSHFEKGKFYKGLALVLHCYSEFQLSRLQASIGEFGKFKFCTRDKKPVW